MTVQPIYTRPEADLIEVRVEQGMAASFNDAGKPGFLEHDEEDHYVI